MVASLRVPNYDDLDILKRIVVERQEGRNAEYFREYQPQWELRVRTYIEAAGDGARIGPSTITADADKKKFINLYSNARENSVQYPVLRALRDTTIVYCPSCGEDGNPETLDHYLPKDEYPEFSVLTKNLTPMCGRCQREKLAKVLDATGQRQFLHPYYDRIEEPVIQIHIDPPYSAGTAFRVELTNGMEDPLRSLVERHVRELKLISRLKDFCTEKYMHLIQMASGEGDAPRTSLLRCLPHFLRMEEQKSANAWGAVFYRSVLANQELLLYLENGNLPANV